MASGLGRRFGGNKLLADFGGKPLIAWILDAAEGLFEHLVVVTRHRDLAEYCESRGISVVLHEKPHRSDTVRLGLEAVGNVSGCLFCPGDQPLLRRETLKKMRKDFEKYPDSILRPQSEQGPGAPVLFPKWAFPELLTLPEGKGGGVVIRAHPEKVRPFPVDSRELLDVDTPQDLERLLGLL